MAASKKQEEKPKLDSGRLFRLVRDCSALKDPRTRLLALILAQNADWKTFETRPTWKCLMKWTRFSKKTLDRHIKKLVDAGVLEKERRYKKSSIFKFNVEKLEQLFDPFKQPEEKEQTSEEAQQEERAAQQNKPKFMCSQCAQEEVVVEGARCADCRHGVKAAPEPEEMDLDSLCSECGSPQSEGQLMIGGKCEECYHRANSELEISSRFEVEDD